MMVIPGAKYHNDNPNIIIFGGALTKNGITSSLLGLLDSLDFDQVNYLVTYPSNKGAAVIETINGFSDDLGYYPIQGEQVMTYSEAIARFLFFRFSIENPWISKRIKSLFSREALRLFPSMSLTRCIHFSGYERSWMHLILGMESEENVIYVHNDMLQERSMMVELSHTVGNEGLSGVRQSCSM